MKIVLAILVVVMPLQSFAQNLSLNSCQELKNNIERYEGLRKKGGSNNQMKHWRKQGRENEEKFKHFSCRKKYGKNLY